MFKKPIEAKALQRLSGADKKKLRRTAKERFPLSSDADIDAILPLKAEITVAKLPNRVHIYGVEGGLPMLFDVDGRGKDIFPTVYALWKVPELLPAFVLKGGEVSRFIIGGADLMFPGISVPSDGLPSFVCGQPWAVKVPGNVAPIAVGTTMMSSVEALKAGLRGKALHVMHYYRDSLWESAEDRHIPNGGFLEDIVTEDPSLYALPQTSDAREDILSDAVDTVSDNNEWQADVPVVHTERDTDSLPGECKNDDLEELGEGMTRLNVSENGSSEQNVAKEHLALPSEIDALLDNCLLQALHTSVRDRDLPLPGSTLWSNHVLTCRPAGTTLDIKRSSHKKLTKWLQLKSSSGLISAREDKHKKEIVLLSVNRAHPDYKSFKPDKLVPKVVNQTHDSSAVDSNQTRSQLTVEEIYKSSTHVNPIFTSVGADTGNYYNASEATDVVFRYVEKENLVKPVDKAMVVFDAILCDALFKGAIKKGTMYPTEIHKKDLGATFLNRMQSFYRVLRGNEVVVVCKGSIKPIQIMTERRQGSKKVTRLSGVEYFLINAESLASELQKKFACSTSIVELPGKKAQNEVLVQGGVIEDLAKHLVDYYGVPKRYIEVLDKTRK